MARLPLYINRGQSGRGKVFSFRCEYCAWLHLACKIENVSGGGALGGEHTRKVSACLGSERLDTKPQPKPTIMDINQLFRRRFRCSSTTGRCKTPASVPVQSAFPAYCLVSGTMWSCPEGGSFLYGDWLVSRFSGAQLGGRRRGASFLF